MKIKFNTLRPWLDEIFLSIKKDIKTDYLPGSPSFYRTHFGSRPLNRLGVEEIHAAFSKELLEGNDDLAEWVINRWVFKHGELYRHFALRLEEINPDFGAIESLTNEQSEQILAGAKDAFGAQAVYCFSILNGVVFPDAILARLRLEAELETAKQQVEQEEISQQKDLAKILEHHQREIARLTDKYESKLAGVLKKYTTDTESLKKQIRALQKK